MMNNRDRHRKCNYYAPSLWITVYVLDYAGNHDSIPVSINCGSSHLILFPSHKIDALTNNHSNCSQQTANRARKVPDDPSLNIHSLPTSCSIPNCNKGVKIKEGTIHYLSRINITFVREQHYIKVLVNEKLETFKFSRDMCYLRMLVLFTYFSSLS